MRARTEDAAHGEAARECVCFNLRKAARAVTQFYDAALAASGVRATQFTVLVALSLSERLSLTQIAERLVMDRTTLTRNLRPLERDGLVRIERGPDRRERYMRLTAAGRKRLDRALPLWRKAQRRMTEAIGEEAWLALRGGLRGIASSVRAARSSG